ncbi:MAG TPA: hypothetical protein VK543_09110 [Puia sp.]|nr:hypothetical protein [Puia sp.]
MEKLKLTRPWEEVTEKLKEVNVGLTDDDLRYIPGNEEELLTRLARKMKKTPADIKVWIESVSVNEGFAG